MHPVVYIIFIICYKRQHDEYSGNVFDENNRYWCISYLFNVSVNWAACDYIDK